MITSIWNTIECDAWSRDYRFSEYIAFHKKTGSPAAPLSSKAYVSLCTMFYDLMEEEFELQKAERETHHRRV